MPTVPTINRPQVEAQALPGARLTAVPSGASPIGDALQNAGHAINQVYSDQRRKAQSTMYADSLTRLKQAQITQEHDPKTGWRQSKGSDSFGLHDTVLPEYDKQAEQIAESIPDQDVRSRFQVAANDQRVDLNQRLDGWVSDQHQQYEAKVLDDGVRTSQQAAALNWQNPERVGREISDQSERILAYQGQNGLPPEWAQARMQQAASDTHGNVIDQMLTAGNDAAAKTYLDRHKAEMTADAIAHYGKSVDYSNTLAQSQTETARIYNADKSLEDMAAEADKITDQKVQAATKQRLENMFTLHRQAVDQHGSKLLDDALRISNQDPRGIDAIPPQQLAELNTVDPKRFGVLMATAQRRVRREDITTPEGYSVFTLNRSALSGALGEEAKNNAIKEDPNNFADKLNRADLDGWHVLRDKAMANKVPKGLLNVEEVANQTLRSVGLNPAPDKDGKVDARVTHFRVLFNRAIEASGGTDKLTGDQMQKQADKLIMEQAVPDPASTTGKILGMGGYGPLALFGVGVDGTKNVRTFDLPNADRMAFSAAQLPSTGRDRAKAALVAQGIPNPTDEQILDTYNAAVIKAPK